MIMVRVRVRIRARGIGEIGFLMVKHFDTPKSPDISPKHSVCLCVHLSVCEYPGCVSGVYSHPALRSFSSSPHMAIKWCGPCSEDLWQFTQSGRT